MCQFANKTRIYKLKRILILTYLTLTYLTIINISMNKFNKIFCNIHGNTWQIFIPFCHN